MPRQPPPYVALEAILEKEEAAARRVRAAGAMAVVALLLAGLLLALGRDPEPPVHLNLRVVDAMPDEAGLGSLESAPREVRGP